MELFDDPSAAGAAAAASSPSANLRYASPSLTPSPPPSRHLQLAPLDDPQYRARTRSRSRGPPRTTPGPDDETLVAMSDIEYEDGDTLADEDDHDHEDNNTPSHSNVKTKCSRSLLYSETSSFPKTPICMCPSPSSVPCALGPSTVRTYTQTVNMMVPAPKSRHHWAVGQTLRTSMARVRFIVCCKVCPFPAHLIYTVILIYRFTGDTHNINQCNRRVQTV